MKPAKVRRQSESEPPARASSVSPSRRESPAVAIASAPDVHAEESVSTGPSAAAQRARASPGPLYCCEVTQSRQQQEILSDLLLDLAQVNTTVRRIARDEGGLDLEKLERRIREVIED